MMRMTRDAFLYIASLMRYLVVVYKESAENCDRLKMLHAFSGSIKLIDAIYLAKLLRREKPKDILEVGSFLGFSCNWLLTVSSPWNARVVAVDPNIAHRGFSNPRHILRKVNDVFSDRLTIVTAYFGTPPAGERENAKVIDSGWSEKFDVVFVDGNHSYESVINNFQVGSTLLRPNGVIAFHDAISWPEVSRAIEDIKQQSTDFDVVIQGRHAKRLCEGVALLKRTQQYNR